MANRDIPKGLTPMRYQGGACYTGAANRYYVAQSDSTAIYVGALVKPSGSADSRGVMGVTGNVSTGDAVVGVVVAVDPITADSEIYRPASQERYVMVADDPNLLFEVQDDASVTLGAANVGNSADLTGFTSGSTITGLSTTEISATSATASGDGSEDVLIVSLSDREDNSLGDNGKWLVRLNNHFLVDGQAGA